MQAYYGGAIMEGCRGGLAVVITRDGTTQNPNKPYEVFLEAILSPEFLNLTGVRVYSNPIERVYIGVSSDTGKLLVREVTDKVASSINLISIDRLAVLPHFIEKTSTVSA